MRDYIDERNRRDELKRSVIKRANVHYITVEELQKQNEEEEKKREQEALERQRAEAAAQEAVLAMKRKREMEQKELLERAMYEASLPPSSHYGEHESDEVTKEQVEAILAEKQDMLEKVIEDNKEIEGE